VTDVLIAEGGLVGLAVAIQLGQSAFRPNCLSMEKSCGEGLMPAGVAALERLGPNGEKGAPFNGVRNQVGERIAEGRFSEARGLAGKSWRGAV
jgi:2-polyprenyl-6-methoxyphenol hydroxylase-like FAD-dependent oxidoreductase